MSISTSPGDAAETRSMPLVATSLIVAIACSMNVAYSSPPSATVVNQSVAWLGWGAATVLLIESVQSTIRSGDVLRLAGLPSVLGGLLTVAISTLASPLWTGLPWSPALLTTALTIAAAGVLVVTGASVAQGAIARGVATRALGIALVAGGVLASSIGIVQVFFPEAADGYWIAVSAGRAAGNLRQPNHLADFLLWSLVATVWLSTSAPRYRALCVALSVLLMSGVVLSSSRTGAVGVVLLAVWGLVDRQLDHRARGALVLAPILYVLMWLAFSALTAGAEQGGYVGPRRLQEGDPTGSRFAIWANTLELIRTHPWLGVGAAEFNFAWTLTEFPQRPREFFDHSHNLLLQVVVELGAPLGLAVVAALLHAFWRSFIAARDAPDVDSVAVHCAFMMLVISGLHSLLEYPLWYAHFLFPTAFVWGYCLGAVPVTGAPDGGPGAAGTAAVVGKVSGVLMMLGAVVALWDHSRVTPIFIASAELPLVQRIQDGQRSMFFAHHADYALVTTTDRPGAVIDAFKRPAHHLLDTRLMIAWSKALAATGDVDRARWLAARLAEFHHPDAQSFFAPCASPPADGAARPFQCEPPQRRYTFKDFR